MSRSLCGPAGLLLLVAGAPAFAGGVDALQGKFAFNWHAATDSQKCVTVAGPLLTEFKSAKYRCDLNVKSNTSSGAAARTCTAVKGDKEYLIFDTLRACEEERKSQASNE